MLAGLHFYFLSRELVNLFRLHGEQLEMKIGRVVFQRIYLFT